MKTRTMVVITLGLALAAGCKKKDQDPKGTATGSDTGSAAMKPNEGSGAMKPPEAPKPKTGKDLAQTYLDCGKQLSEARWDDFMKACSADKFVAHWAGMPDMTRDAVVPGFKDMKTAFPDLKIEPQLVLVTGRTVLAVTLMTGTHDGPMKTPMGEVPATKKKFGALAYHRLAFDDENKVAEEWGYSDPATMMAQLGQLPKGAPPLRPAMEQGMAGAPVIAVAADDDKERQNLETVKQSNAAFAAMKPAESMAAWADDAVESDQASGMDMKGKQEIEKGTVMFQKAFPDLKIETTGTWAAGDYVVVEGTFTGTNTGPMGPMPKTGKQVTGKFAEVVKLENGKITEMWRFRNGMEMAMQLGMMPMPGDAMKGGAAPKQ